MPYGAVAAARMNAEYGSNYDVERYLDWIFSEILGALLLDHADRVLGRLFGLSASGRAPRTGLSTPREHHRQSNSRQRCVDGLDDHPS